jgi:hypothetical protein
LTLSDSARSYEGEDFEQVSIHIYEALNYMALGLWDEARVEALQVDVRLKRLADGDSTYVEDAFSRYLTGIIYEFSGEADNAMIAYRKAYQAHEKNGLKLKMPTHSFLKQDLLRLSQELGLESEHEQFKEAFSSAGDIPSPAVKKEQGEVVLLLHHSLAPIKRSISMPVYTDTGVPHRISVPKYQSRFAYIAKARFTVGNKSIGTVVANNFDAIARASLKSHEPAMIARLLARVVLKAAISNQAEQRAGDLAGILVDVVAFATETADTRSWLTLPQSILLSRLMLEPGVYPVSITLFDIQGSVIATLDLGDIAIKKGKKVFIEESFIAPNQGQK